MIAGLATAALLVASAFFFTAGILGLLRFPDTLTRLHALTKADNLGMGCLVAGLMLQAETLAAAAKLGLIWLLAMFVGASTSYLVARHTLYRRARPGQAVHRRSGAGATPGSPR